MSRILKILTIATVLIFTACSKELARKEEDEVSVVNSVVETNVDDIKGLHSLLRNW